MSKPLIICVEDEPEVRDALERDLEPFAAAFEIELTEDAEEAREVIAAAVQESRPLALALVDHILPGALGVDLLVELSADPATALMRKILVTGQAGQADTIRAINQARINHYIAKPWTKEALLEVVRSELTDFVIAELEDLLPFVQVLDAERLMEAIKDRRDDA